MQPLVTASSIKSWPSKLRPVTGIKKSPFSRVLESVEIELIDFAGPALFLRSWTDSDPDHFNNFFMLIFLPVFNYCPVPSLLCLSRSPQAFTVPFSSLTLIVPLPYNFLIAKVDLFIRKFLIIFMSFACNQYDIFFPRHFKSFNDGRLPVRDFFITC